MEIDLYIRSECERQHTTNINEMRRAFVWAASFDKESTGNIGFLLQSIAKIVEPDVNAWDASFSNLRKSEVGFANGGRASRAIDVERHFERLLFLYSGDLAGQEFEDWCKFLLDIHPWADGNGRTVSIFRNWHLGQMDDPEPLPYYYGQN